MAQSLVISVTGVSPTATISNLHFTLRVRQQSDPDVYERVPHQLQPFSTIRFVDWMGTIDSTVSTWQQRTPPTSFLSTGPAGVPYEDMIELANETQKDMWINIPALATTNYVQNLAQLIDAISTPISTSIVEYSNETWNAGYSGYSQVLQAAHSDHLVTATNAEARSNSRAPTSSQRTD